MVLMWLLAFLAFAPLAYIFLNTVLPSMLPTQDLKLKYKATWALVTGGSSGIGKELARKLLSQGLNVVIVAREEPVFNETIKELKALFPKQEIKQVNVDLSDGTGAWMETVKAATEGIDVQAIFLNAGYILTGFFDQRSAEAQLANFNCNLSANVRLTHHFYSALLTKGLRGCIVFTSSSAGFIPNPFAVMYGCTKAGLSEFAASLAVEGKARGIDVHAVHPSPVSSRFTSGGGNKIDVHKMDSIEAFYKLAVGPEGIPDQIFAGIGRAPVLYDLGLASIGMRLVVHFLGFNLLTYIFALAAPLMPDYKNNINKKAA